MLGAVNAGGKPLLPAKRAIARGRSPDARPSLGRARPEGEHAGRRPIGVAPGGRAASTASRSQGRTASRAASRLDASPITISPT
jgi:hypothetical protein